MIDGQRLGQPKIVEASVQERMIILVDRKVQRSFVAIYRKNERRNQTICDRA